MAPERLSNTTRISSQIQFQVLIDKVLVPRSMEFAGGNTTMILDEPTAELRNAENSR